jgi:hypothetical protein
MKWAAESAVAKSLAGVAGGTIGEAAGEAAGQAVGDVASNVAESGLGAAQELTGAGEIANSVGGAQGYTAAGMSSLPSAAPSALEAAPAMGLDAAAPAATNASTPLAVPDAVAPTVSVNGPAPVSIDPYQQYQSTMMEAGQRTLGGTAADSPIQQWLNKITGGMKAVNDVIKDNKELIQLGGQMLGAAYGPQAEQIDLQKSIWNSQQKNLNTPVKLYYRKG